MRLSSRLLIVFVTCLMAMALSSVPAQAQCGAPSIKLSPNLGAPGTEVTVNGQNFGTGKYVDIYYDGTMRATGKTDSWGDFTILFTIPESYKGTYIVQAVVVHDTANAVFTVKPGLRVRPEKGPVGTNVTVKGQGFAKKEEGIELIYYFDGGYQKVERDILANAQGSWEISFPIPPSTGGEHKLGAQSAESQPSEVKDATFKVTPGISLDKPSGFVGESITMTGSQFAPYEKGIQILFAGQAVVPDIKANGQGDWEESFEVPEMSTGTYIVTAQSTVTQKEDIIAFSFEIKPDIVLSPDEGYVGMNLTVTGHGFAANGDVAIMYDGRLEKTAETNDKGSFDNASFVAPESQHGERQVIAKDAAGNNASAIFTMESDPPGMPALISPSKGGWVGLVGKVTPMFEWSEVSDDSGVRYRLQIATSANVTATGEFVDPLVSVPDIVGTNYTLEKKDALPYGTYYWIVQAIDRAENAGNWTAAYSFRAGLLPIWGFIAAIVATVVLLGALIYFFIIRRRRYYYG
ncbi:MAG: IPT/TIG domain-containing protein [Dehalococcoidia bacterium]